MVRYIFIFLALVVTLMGSSTYYKLSLGSFINSQNAENGLIHFKKVLENDKDYQDFSNSLNFELFIVKSKKYYVITIRPIQKREDAVKLLSIVRNHNKASFMGTYKSKLIVENKERKKEVSSLKEEVAPEVKILSELELLQKKWSY